jgi:hypothetical protein
MRRKHFQISVVLNLKKCKICEHGFIGIQMDLLVFRMDLLVFREFIDLQEFKSVSMDLLASRSLLAFRSLLTSRGFIVFLFVLGLSWLLIGFS